MVAAVLLKGLTTLLQYELPSTIVIAYKICIKTATAYMDFNDWYIILIVIL